MDTKTIDELFVDLNKKHIHVVGIKGTGCAALVEILVAKGAVVTGSDTAEVFYTDAILKSLDISPKLFSKDNITGEVDFVIHSSAYHESTNPDLAEAAKRGVPCVLYTEALGAVSRLHDSVAVCGVHGKTSTTGLCGSILRHTALDFGVLAGSVISSFNNHCTFTSHFEKPESIFVAETCEYQKHFMAFSPRTIILTAVESDHEDFYPTFDSIKQAFADFVRTLPDGGLLIYCADDEGAVAVADIVKKTRSDIRFVSYGAAVFADYCLIYGEEHNGKNEFSVAKRGDGNKKLGNFALQVPGKHMALNACAAIALVCEIFLKNGDSFANHYDEVKAGVFSFRGGARRSEVLGKIKVGGNDVLVIDDYGHHPTAIKTTLQGYRDFYPGRKIIVDFMSHTYSRTQALLPQFGAAFVCADEVILHKIYSSARENPADFSIDGNTLCKEVMKHNTNVYYFNEIMEALPFVENELQKPLDTKEYPNGYLFVTMGAGDNFKLSHKLVESHS